jgi:hypothetical protein
MIENNQDSKKLFRCLKLIVKIIAVFYCIILVCVGIQTKDVSLVLFVVGFPLAVTLLYYAKFGENLWIDE